MTISSLTNANVSASYAAASTSAKAPITNMVAAAPKASASAVTVSISSAGRAAAAAATTTTSWATFATAYAAKGSGAALDASYDLKISKSELTTADNLVKLKDAAAAGKINSITLSDTAPISISLDQTDATLKLVAGNDLSKVLSKITSAHKLVLTKTTAADVSSLKSTSANETLDIQVSDTLANVKNYATTLQAAAKAGSLTDVALSSSATDLTAWTVTAKDYTVTYANLMNVLKGTNAAKSVIVTGASVKNYTDIKASVGGATSLLDKNIRSLDISDTAANILSKQPDLKAGVALGAGLKNISALKLTDSITNILKSGASLVYAAVKDIDANFGTGTAKVTINLVSEAKPVKASVAETGSLNDLKIALNKVAISDKAINLVAQKRNELNSTLTSTASLLAGVASVSVTDTDITMSVADIKVLNGAGMGTFDKSKLKWNIADSAANIVADAGNDAVKKAKAISITSTMTIAQAKDLVDKTKFPTLPNAGALTVIDTAAAIAAENTANLDGLIAKGFTINIADTAAGLTTNIANIDARIGRISNIKLDTVSNATTDTTFAAKATIDLSTHTATMGHVVDAYTQAT